MRHKRSNLGEIAGRLLQFVNVIGGERLGGLRPVPVSPTFVPI